MGTSNICSYFTCDTCGAVTSIWTENFLAEKLAPRPNKYMLGSTSAFIILTNLRHANLYCWSIWAFSMRLSFARRFWNQIFICVSDNLKLSANSNRLPLDMYSFRWNSTSNRNVCSLLNVVRCLRGRPSFRRRLATMRKIKIISHSHVPVHI